MTLNELLRSATGSRPQAGPVAPALPSSKPSKLVCFAQSVGSGNPSFHAPWTAQQSCGALFLGRSRSLAMKKGRMGLFCPYPNPLPP